jgi:hypothetical protein
LPELSGPKISTTRPRGNPPIAERDVEAERTGRDCLDVDGLVSRTEPHDRPFAELLLDVRQRCVQRLVLIHIVPLDDA